MMALTEMTEAQRIRLENIANTEYEIFALLKQRFSPRIFRDIKIKEEHLKQLFEAVRWSPSVANEQPWRFLYAEKGSDTYGQIVSSLTPEDQRWATNAPVLMVTAYKGQLEDGTYNFHALYDLGLSLGCMTIQAQYLGIGVHHIEGFDMAKAREFLNVPERYYIASTIALGYFGGDLDQLPDDLKKRETEERTRMKQENFAYKNYWNNQPHYEYGNT